MRPTKLRRFRPLPVVQQRGPRDPAVIKALRLMGLTCMGPYHNDRWYIFWPKPKASKFTGK